MGELVVHRAPLRTVPARITGYGDVRPFTGAFDNLGIVQRASVKVASAMPGKSKVLPTLQAAIEACGLKDGSVVSFHHHLRNGDRVLAMVIAEIERAGLRDITIAPSSLFPAHAPLVPYLENGVVAAEAKVGAGKVLLFGPEILQRAQPHGTFKFLFNGIYYSVMNRGIPVP